MPIRLLLTILLIPLCIRAQSNSDTLRKHVVRLSTLPYPRNSNNPTSLNKSADYIEQYFLKYSEKVVFQKYDVNEVAYKNVIASFGPENAIRCIIGAHYDVFSESPGADANASGVAALLELSRLLKNVENQLAFRVDLVAYTLAEPPFENSKGMGSYIHAQSLKENQVNILGMVNLDCIGFFIDKRKSQRYPFFLYRWLYGNRGNFIALIQQPGNGTWASRMRSLLRQYTKGLRFHNFKPSVPFKGFAIGDHSNYWSFGYPAILISNTKFYRNRNFHFDLDTYEKLDYFRMSKVVDMVYQSIIHYRL